MGVRGAGDEKRFFEALGGKLPIYSTKSLIGKVAYLFKKSDDVVKTTYEGKTFWCPKKKFEAFLERNQAPKRDQKLTQPQLTDIFSNMVKDCGELVARLDGGEGKNPQEIAKQLGWSRNRDRFWSRVDHYVQQADRQEPVRRYALEQNIVSFYELNEIAKLLERFGISMEDSLKELGIEESRPEEIRIDRDRFVNACADAVAEWGDEGTRRLREGQREIFSDPNIPKDLKDTLIRLAEDVHDRASKKIKDKPEAEAKDKEPPVAPEEPVIQEEGLAEVPRDLEEVLDQNELTQILDVLSGRFGITLQADQLDILGIKGIQELPEDIQIDRGKFLDVCADRVAEWGDEGTRRLREGQREIFSDPNIPKDLKDTLIRLAEDVHDKASKKIEEIKALEKEKRAQIQRDPRGPLSEALKERMGDAVKDLADAKWLKKKIVLTQKERCDLEEELRAAVSNQDKAKELEEKIDSVKGKLVNLTTNKEAIELLERDALLSTLLTRDEVREILSTHPKESEESEELRSYAEKVMRLIPYLLAERQKGHSELNDEAHDICQFLHDRLDFDTRRKLPDFVMMLKVGSYMRGVRALRQALSKYVVPEDPGLSDEKNLTFSQNLY